MRTFIIRARKGVTAAERIPNDLGKGAHIEVIAHAVASAVFLSNAMRPDVVMHIVMESSSDFPRTLSLFTGEGLSLPGFHEEAILSTIGRALKRGERLSKDETLQIADGISLSGFGFERLIQQMEAGEQSLYLLHPKGTDIRETDLREDCAFILTDHIPMPKKSLKYLDRLKVNRISLGPKALFAAHCITVVHNELDRRLVLN